MTCFRVLLMDWHCTINYWMPIRHERYHVDVPEYNHSCSGNLALLTLICSRFELVFIILREAMALRKDI